MEVKTLNLLMLCGQYKKALMLLASALATLNCVCLLIGWCSGN
jgi:hypothetical protein